jgi:hypothetical protein
MEEHVRDASSGRFLEGRQDTPDAVDLLFHVLLILFDQLPAIGVIMHGLDWILRGVEADIPEFVNHVTLGMPVLVLAVAEYLDKLFEDGSLAAAAALCKLGRVVVVAVDLAIVLIVAVLGAKHS